MALTTAQDLIDFALRVSSVVGVGQAPVAADEADGLLLLNMLLSEWQLNRWLVWDVIPQQCQSTGVTNYRVGAGGDFDVSFAGQRPDRVDAAFVRKNGIDTFLYPFMAREGFGRLAAKFSTGIAPEAYYYDAASNLQGVFGFLFFWPVPDVTWELHINVKADLGQFAMTDTLGFIPRQYVTALLWNLAERMRPLYGMQPRPDITAMAQSSLIAIGGSTAQMIQAQQPVPSNRAGVFSHVVPPQAGAPQ